MLAFAPSSTRPLLAKAGSGQARPRTRAAAGPQAFLGGLLQRVAGGGSGMASTAAAKEELLEAIKPLGRGLKATEDVSLGGGVPAGGATSLAGGLHLWPAAPPVCRP